MWDSLKTLLLNPKLDDAALQIRLEQVKQQLPTPVFWLLGKAQSGKTSLIRAMTGDSRARIGDGIRPCTRTAYVYDFPGPDDAFLKFLDTRGLGEVDYDPAEDLQLFQEQSHVLMVTLKAMDHAQDAVLKALQDILAQRAGWPVIVAQTSLHEGYPSPEFEHIQPYPFGEAELPPSVPSELARSLAAQREWFRGIDAHFVAIDFTQEEDGYRPVHYGLEALWNTIEQVLPLGLAAMIRNMDGVRKELDDLYQRTAHPHILAYSVAAGAAGAIPAPFVDVPLVTAIQAKLCHTVASIYDQPLDQRGLTDLGSALGMSFLGNLGRRELLKFVPIYGAAVSALLTAAATFALGKTLGAYFTHIRRGSGPDPKLLRRLYAEQFEQGQRLLKEYIDNLYRKDKS